MDRKIKIGLKIIVVTIVLVLYSMLYEYSHKLGIIPIILFWILTLIGVILLESYSKKW